MKKIWMLAMVLVMSMTGFVYAAGVTQGQKDECLLSSRNCLNQAQSIQEKIQRLQQEIQKGTKVYTPQELKKLQDKLKETEDTLDTILEGGSGN